MKKKHKKPGKLSGNIIYPKRFGLGEMTRHSLFWNTEYLESCQFLSVRMELVNYPSNLLIKPSAY